MKNYRKEVEELFDFSTNLELPLLMNALIEHCNNYQIHPTDIKTIIERYKFELIEEVLLFRNYYEIDVCYANDGLCLELKHTLLLE